MDIFKFFLDYLYSKGLDNHHAVYLEDGNPFGEYVYYDCEVGRRIFTDLNEFQQFLKNKKY